MLLRSGDSEVMTFRTSWVNSGR